MQGRGTSVTSDRRSIGVSAALLAVLAVAGCGGEEQAASPAGEEAAAWSVEGTPSPGKKGARPERVTSGGPPKNAISSLPPDFPGDVPQYPGADFKTGRTSTGQGLSMTLTSGDDFEKVASFYADGFAAEGWATDIRRTPEGKAIFAEKGNRSASAFVRGADEGTLVDLVLIVR